MSDWRPIETAPKDGSEVILSNGYWAFEATSLPDGRFIRTKDRQQTAPTNCRWWAPFPTPPFKAPGANDPLAALPPSPAEGPAMTEPASLVEKVARALESELSCYEAGQWPALGIDGTFDAHVIARAALAAVSATLSPDLRLLSEELARSAEQSGRWDTSIADALARLDAALSPEPEGRR